LFILRDDWPRPPSIEVVARLTPTLHCRNLRRGHRTAQRAAPQRRKPSHCWSATSNQVGTHLKPRRVGVGPPRIECVELNSARRGAASFATTSCVTGARHYDLRVARTGGVIATFPKDATHATKADGLKRIGAHPASAGRSEPGRVQLPGPSVKLRFCEHGAKGDDPLGGAPPRVSGVGRERPPRVSGVGRERASECGPGMLQCSAMGLKPVSTPITEAGACFAARPPPRLWHSRERSRCGRGMSS